MKITDQHIEQLYAFTRQHFVEYYDLQTELVDHLANGIERQWRENPKLTFEEALQKEFKKFGVFGFMTVVEQRQAALTKKYNGLVWNHFKMFFKTPKIVLSLIAVLLLKLILSKVSFAEELTFALFLGLLLMFFTGLVLSRRKINVRFKSSGKKWMLEQIIYNYGSFAGLTYLPMQLLLRLFNHTDSAYVLWIVSTGIVVMALLEYILLVEIPKKSEVYLLETYPEYKFANSL
ncbi:hypothetical protein LZZ90_02345 [Flavobacterium sp. SM15]|uniref:hypothetical protein n=1 Tax=Flavobacterium sp. SM15 TaxID=2908005 RepID=UPI001ED9F099|nr:hypothetical protein [Flavobacterium sp. SM15]MCG2610345.1 hypothetical protein [Flavobacterium sp. SM15]